MLEYAALDVSRYGIPHHGGRTVAPRATPAAPLQDYADPLRAPATSYEQALARVHGSPPLDCIARPMRWSASRGWHPVDSRGEDPRLRPMSSSSRPTSSRYANSHRARCTSKPGITERAVSHPRARGRPRPCTSPGCTGARGRSGCVSPAPARADRTRGQARRRRHVLQRAQTPGGPLLRPAGW